MILPVETSDLESYISKEDYILLDTILSNPIETKTSGRFLTIHKRRRKKLTTRNLAQDSAILDDIHHGQVQKILDRCNMWAFNAFTLETVAGGRALTVLCVHLFHWYGLLDYFQLDVVHVWKLFTLIEEGYHASNPYHNSIHATDVTQAMHCFLQEEKIKKYLTPLEVMASLIGAVAHDLDHPGVNQHFLISTSNHLAILYQNMSVLENHHWRSAVGCLLESGVADQVLAYRNELESQIRDLILATDINRQQEFLNKFKNHLDNDTLDLSKVDDRSFILQIALKCADISNPTRPWDISHKWSMKVCDEFFRQGEFERKLNLPVTSICDKQSTSVAKIQVGFFRFVVTPLFTEWHRFLKSTLSTRMINWLISNRKKWEKQETNEQTDEIQTELSDADVDASVIDDDLTVKRSTPSITDFIPSPEKMIRRQSLAVPSLESALGVRRHSVPVNIETPYNVVVARRESLPVGRGGVVPIVTSGRSTANSMRNDTKSPTFGLREEDEIYKFDSQSSEVSSDSPNYSTAAEDLQPERPLSAENLLPEPNIASMTSIPNASKLSTVLQGSTTTAPPTKCLTRQQTFPPPQPYIRMRYMSATCEMTTCPEALLESESRSNSSHGSPENISNNLPTQYTIPSIAVLSPNNGRAMEFAEQETTHNNNNKREQEDVEEKTNKIVKLSEPNREKENVDPRKLTIMNLARRRGSAPVTLPLRKCDEKVNNNGSKTSGLFITPDKHALRRGSVPIEFSHYCYEKEELIESIMNVTPIDPTQSFWHCQRGGGGVPSDLIKPLQKGRGGDKPLSRHISFNGKSNRRKKQLYRRSSGGPETVCLPELNTEAFARLMLRRSDNSDTLLVRRRGSLPIEVLTVGHSVF